MTALLYPDIFRSLESVRWNLETDVPWNEFDASQALRRAGADDQDERDHRVVGAARHRNVPARQPRRFGLLRLHVGLVFRGTEARAGADGISAPVPARPGAERRRAARGALRVRSGAAARNADDAFLRRSPAQSLVPARVRVAHRAGDQGDLQAAVAGRGAPWRRLPALHEKVAVRAGRHRARGIRQDRRADGVGQAHRQGVAPDQSARQPVAVSARHHPIAPARSRLARALARQTDQVRQGVGNQGRRAHPAQPVAVVRAHVYIGAGFKPVPERDRRPVEVGGAAPQPA